MNPVTERLLSATRQELRPFFNGEMELIREDRQDLTEATLRAVGEHFIATLRSKRVSRALYTSPMPPAPMRERTS